MKSVCLLLLLFSGIVCYAQPVKYENLVFEGGGARGIVYIGALKQLEIAGITRDIRRVGGNSAGAIVALMVSLGYTPGEIEDVIVSQQLQKFRARHFLFIGARHSLAHHYGWYSSRRVATFLGQLIAAKTGDADITFAGLMARGYKELRVTGTCVNRQQGMVLSAQNYPRMKVRDAVLISCSIPLVFHAVFVDSMGAVHKHQDKHRSCDIFIDGLIGNNYPVAMFDSAAISATGQQVRIPDMRTLGFQVTSLKQMDCDKAGKGLAGESIHRFSDYAEAIFCYTLESINRSGMTKEDWARTVSLPTLGVSAQLNKLSKERTAELITTGQEYTRKYLEEHRPLVTGN